MTDPTNCVDFKVALVGQPNSGKSTLFNSIAGFKVYTGNFSGSTVTFEQTKVQIHDKTVKLIDLPGTYSITSQDLAEKVARDFLLSGEVDLIINVIDASMLSRSLELTIQLVEMDVPMVIALNMMDEAQRKGIEIDIERFTKLTGLRIFPIVAVYGKGLEELFKAVVEFDPAMHRVIKPVYDRDVEQSIEKIIACFDDEIDSRLLLNHRFIAIRLLEMDQDFENRVASINATLLDRAIAERKELAELHNWPEEEVFASHRHAIVLDLYEKVAQHKRGNQKDVRDVIDSYLLNPISGGLLSILFLFVVFYASFWLGEFVAGLINSPFSLLRSYVTQAFHGMVQVGMLGLVDGVEGGLGIVVPYLVPLLFLLSIYEDSGLLPRLAFMLDGLFHKFGLHGKSVIPIILGYGCNVPALIATRNLENQRDRKLALLIIPFITCSARTVIILGLVGRYIGALATTLIYLGTIFVTLVLSFILSKLHVDMDTGLLMEVPPLRRPHLRIISKKIWFRLREFLVLAWPVLAASSVALSLASAFAIDRYVNSLLAPITESMLRLPKSIGITLFLGFFKKELAIVMLNSALGTHDVSAVLSTHQLLTFTVFTVLYIPCIATLTTLKKEAGIKIAATSAVLNLITALAVASVVAAVF